MDFSENYAAKIYQQPCACEIMAIFPVLGFDSRTEAKIRQIWIQKIMRLKSIIGIVPSKISSQSFPDFGDSWKHEANSNATKFQFPPEEMTLSNLTCYPLLTENLETNVSFVGKKVLLPSTREKLFVGTEKLSSWWCFFFQPFCLPKKREILITLSLYVFLHFFLRKHHQK